MKKAKFITILFALTAAFLLVAAGCKSEDSDDGTPSSSASREKPTVANVCVFYTPGSLGDGAYSDTLCLGVHKTALEKNLSVMDICPTDWKDAEETVNMLLKTVGAGNKDKTLYVFADALYSSYLLPLKDKTLVSETFLLLDSKESAEQKLNTVFMSFYGTSYLAGLAAKSLLSQKDSPRVLSVLANDSSAVILDSMNGFASGYGVNLQDIKICDGFPSEQVSPEDFDEISEGGFCAIRFSASEDFFAGYKSAGFLYNAASVIQASFPFDFYFPLCGSSVQGLLRYNREKGEKSFYTAGVDIDYSPYSKQVPFSVVKHIDSVASDCIKKWLNDKLPHHQELGLGDGVMELVVSQEFASLAEVVSGAKNTAVEKEGAYEKAKSKK